ncbi:penicillin-binding transpeptidase domain-containing protein [Paenibacillus crassostreae]|uniref:Stage V sporulation protein D n=1 Tax=Paenibacillus crassostreae TaxID=1763538 RepID=A0A167C3T5_9BACL|nr:penicillin-binding transpeptidase domain-containing protein [Paenibacillus crassostreae]AOZ91681.1 stage V sporulation protein D [Paenibacillus crassostreae]OAB72746.1 stage V sporulation protein D [Paenibacillus crassostreae]
MVKRIKLRTLLVGGCITLLFAILITKVFWIQVVNGDFWHETAVENWSKKDVIMATRGTITDRNGDALAIDAPAYTVTVNPKVIHENGIEDVVVAGLHRILGKDEDELRDHVKAKDEDGKLRTSREVRTEGWKIDQAKRDEVATLIDEIKVQLEDEGKVADAGIGLLKEQKRYYPKNSLAAHIIGYADRDGNAITGLEAFYDDELKGINGSINYKSDGQLDKLPNADEVYQPAVNGKNIKLTIDDTIQYYIEDAMKEAYEKYNPISMTVIAADPNTMEILGLANLPNFNPNSYWETPEAENFYNHAVKSLYEPGSTFKIITLAGAIEENLINPTDTYLSGQIRVQDTRTVLHDMKRAGWGTITYLEGVKRSSNVAFVKMGLEMLGKERLLQYINNFGFGQKTGIEMYGEATWPINLPGNVEVATASYGHGVNVTPIQQLTAIAAIANGGKLLTPHIIKEIHDPNTGEITETPPSEVRQVVSPETAKETGSYLEQVVADQEIGTGRHAYIDGYRVAGKTGTAVKLVKDENGKSVYDYDKAVVSFVGYAPVNDPKIALIVILDEPNDANVGGGAAAAPVFKKIVSQTLQYMNVPTTLSAESKSGSTETKKKLSSSVQSVQYTTPALIGKSLESAKSELLDSGIAYETLGKGKKVIRQYPAVSSIMNAGQRIYLLTEDSVNMEIPDLKGESLRDALQVLTLMQLKISVEGEGYVVEQKVIEDQGDRLVQLTLEPLYVAKEEGGFQENGIQDSEIQDSETEDVVKEEE